MGWHKPMRNAETKPTAPFRFLAVGHNGLRLTSVDGSQWSVSAQGKEGEIYCCVRFGNGVWNVAGAYGGSNIFAATREGVQWETQSRDAKYSFFVKGLGFGKGNFVALGPLSDDRGFALLSPDGVTWSKDYPFQGSLTLRRLVFGADRFVAVGDKGRKSFSPDGITWADVPNTRPIDTLIDLTYGNGLFVGGGLHGSRMTSPDGKTWSARQIGEEGEHINSMLWAKDRFVGVGLGGTYFSADGRKWDRQPNTDAPLTATYGNGLFVGASWKGRLLLSKDAITWKEVYKSDHHIEAVAYGGPA